MRVLTAPGHSALTRSLDPVAARSWASAREAASAAYFVTAYPPAPGVANSPATDTVLTMCPSVSCSIMRGTNSWMPCSTPHTFTPSSQAKSSSPRVHMWPPWKTPALLHSTCTAPNSPKHRLARCRTAEASDTSVIWVSTLASPASAAVRASPPWSTSASIKAIPSAANRRASARPMPLAAPVTTATLPESSRTNKPP